MKKNPRISLIAAIGARGELGAQNRLLWHIPADLKRFKKITLGAPVIMGENTFYSLPSVLPGRMNIVLTKKRNFKQSGIRVAHSIPAAIRIAKLSAPKEIFFIGGASIYAQAIKICDRIYLTKIHQSFPQADVFFPNYKDFKTVIYKKEVCDRNYKFTFLILEKCPVG